MTGRIVRPARLEVISARPSLPLTAYQRDLWIAQSYYPNVPLLNLGGYKTLRGRLDIDLFKTCVERAIERNDAFHLRFGADDGALHQHVERCEFALPIIDLSSSADAPAACVEWMQRELRKPFEVEGGRLFDCALLVESTDTLHFFMKIHHLIIDGWGSTQFCEEACHDYDHVLRTGVMAAHDRPSYLAFVEDEQRYRRSAAYEQDREFWRNALLGVQPPLFARKAGRGPGGAHESGRRTLVLPRALVERARVLGGGNGKSIFAFVARPELHERPVPVQGYPAREQRYR